MSDVNVFLFFGNHDECNAHVRSGDSVIYDRKPGITRSRKKTTLGHGTSDRTRGPRQRNEKRAPGFDREVKLLPTTWLRG